MDLGILPLPRVQKRGRYSGRSLLKIPSSSPRVSPSFLAVWVGLMEGGGQPTDTGSLSLLDPNGGIESTWTVEGCLRRKLTAVHLVRLKEGEALSTGSEVELRIDWDRRADHVCLMYYPAPFSLSIPIYADDRWRFTLRNTSSRPSWTPTTSPLYHGQ